MTRRCENCYRFRIAEGERCCNTHSDPKAYDIPLPNNLEDCNYWQPSVKAYESLEAENTELKEQRDRIMKALEDLANIYNERLSNDVWIRISQEIVKEALGGE